MFDRLRERSRAGFALLEAIVALALLAAALVPIFSLMSTSLDGAFRLSQATLRAELEISALEVMRNNNPMAQPEGQILLSPYVITWAARQVTPNTDSVRYPRGIGLYLMALFDTHISVRDQTGKIITEFNLTQVGYKRVREPAIPFSAPAQ